MDKAYIVTNEAQEREVLEKLEREGYVWTAGGEKPTEWSPSTQFYFPYAIVIDGYIYLKLPNDFEKYEIAFDGRKEEKMSEKYVVSQDFMNELEDWKEILRLDNVLFIGRKALSNMPNLLDKWWRDGNVSVHESNNRLIAILRWVNGEDVFEVEKPKKWVVHELNTELYVTTYDGHTGITPNRDYITKFDTKEEAQSWANAHQEVVEV